MEYDILLDGLHIGTTKLERADVPMGVVFGDITFNNSQFGYDFLREYCVVNNLPFSEDIENKVISTNNIPLLKVKNKDFELIHGLSCSISGMDGNDFEIYIIGIDSSRYQMLFPHHVNHYNT
ncbi:hypothetical protein GWR56_17500 [Mucilaginibacter sp. 14171R-50]|uniref:hypothetical protein n=1 Tax=Mucilaginibacter sp. 14171R-50 TaxID=2703789 RepID=UPI00138C50D5|nr:hypothetical protein [Mucilaginibacter sp. 14171R-50]QHS57246.1 hypothetical protein GWR56_17500 [Mucilaginibacter sp. 14171R-50]